jgi:hypothetical protein
MKMQDEEEEKVDLDGNPYKRRRTLEESQN